MVGKPVFWLSQLLYTFLECLNAFLVINGIAERVDFRKRKNLPGSQLPFWANLSNLAGKMAIPARFERATFRLGGGPSILLRYGTMCSKVLIFQGFRGFGDCSPWCSGVVSANRECQFLISFSNFGGRTFSHPLILTSGSRDIEMVTIWIRFRS